MIIQSRIAVLLVGAVLAACNDANGPGEITYEDEPLSAESELVILQEDLQQLKNDFNANQGKVRLLFLSGPTCGICLRGMADLNDEFLAASQNDERLVTFVVHVPTMGAKKNHSKPPAARRIHNSAKASS